MEEGNLGLFKSKLKAIPGKWHSKQNNTEHLTFVKGFTDINNWLLTTPLWGWEVLLSSFKDEETGLQRSEVAYLKSQSS